MPAPNGAFDSDFDAPTHRQQKAQPETDSAAGLPIVEKESNTRENNVAKIKVVVCHLCVSNQYGHILCYDNETSLRLRKSRVVYIFCGVNVWNRLIALFCEQHILKYLWMYRK